MAYSRWGESYWYTYWACGGQRTIESVDSEVFEICGVATFTAAELRDQWESCIENVREVCSKLEKPPTPQELDELRGYVEEFLEDVNIKYSGLQ